MADVHGTRAVATVRVLGDPNDFASCNLAHGLPLSTQHIDDSHRRSWRFDAVAGPPNAREDAVVRVALGLKARTGRALLVAVAGDVLEPQLIERSQMQLLPDGAWAPYHAAEGLEPAKARESVKRSIASAHRLATSGLREAAQRFSAAGHELCGCAVLVGTGMPDWSADQILAVHVRMHKAEGELFRDVLVAAARVCNLELTTLPDKSALDDAAKTLGLARGRLDAHLAALGKAAGPPWGKDQKEAAAAALVALKHFGRRDSPP